MTVHQHCRLHRSKHKYNNCSAIAYNRVGGREMSPGLLEVLKANVEERDEGREVEREM